jgi:hypothetical protein
VEENTEEIKSEIGTMTETAVSAVRGMDSVSLASDVQQGKNVIAQAINVKGGSASATESFTELAEAVEEIPNFDDMVKLAGIIAGGNYNKNALQGHNENVKYGKTEIIDNVGAFETINVPYCFQYWDLLERVDLPNLTTISGGSIFQYCSALQEVNMPQLTTISGNAIFIGCAALTKVVMNAVESISGSNTFEGCAALKEIQMDNLRTMVPLGTLSSLEEFSFPNVTTLNNWNNVWRTYPALKRIILPSLSQVNGQGYHGFFGGANWTNNNIESMKLGTIITDLTGSDGQWNNLRNFEIGYGTNANINFKLWRATNVINEGADAISELNTNIMNGIVANLLQGAGKTFTVGSTLYNVLYPETLQAFAEKGWNIASA